MKKGSTVAEHDATGRSFVVSTVGDLVCVREIAMVGAPGRSRPSVTATHALTKAEFVVFVIGREPRHPRWVWDSTSRWYPLLLGVGVRVERCTDLTLNGVILRASELTAGTAIAGTPAPWPAIPPQTGEATPSTLFEWDDADEAVAERVDELDEFAVQLEAIAGAVDGAVDGARIQLLLSAESAGALVAAEMRHAGLPWHADVHDSVLTQVLGARGTHGGRPEKMEALAQVIRDALDAPSLNPDSQAELLKALKRAGLQITSTRAWDLRELEHAVVAPLLEYKKLSRLHTANGWSWLETWVRDGRFRPDYVPGGVVTGRWATSGGGALQLPKQIRGAVVADPGWKLVVADAAQLEPRVLSALASDPAMAAAGRGQDLYDGLVAAGAVDTRPHAKVAMLGAMYGATTGDSARLMPGLIRAYPRAIALVEAAARTGERGEVVTSHLGRSSPRPGAEWARTQSAASEPQASASDERLARSRARDWGRFTRNFVVQASAAEWALCWMAGLRNRLAELISQTDAPGGAAAPFSRSPHLVFFLHDEVIVHTPASLADQVADIIERSARDAGRLMFGDFPVEFPLSIAIVDDYGSAKD